MTNPTELDFAVATFGEFVKMWRNKSSSKLTFSCEDGNLRLELAADLGSPDQVHHQVPEHHVHLVRKKSPAQIRRNKRRHEAYLQRKTEAAEKVSSGKRNDSPEDYVNQNEADFSDVEAIYEIKVAATENVTQDDIVECFGINFKEALKDIGITDIRSNYEISRKAERNIIKKDGETFRNLQVFKVKIKNVKEAKEVLEGFAKHGGLLWDNKWDNMAFENWQKFNINNTVEIREVKEIVG